MIAEKYSFSTWITLTHTVSKSFENSFLRFFGHQGQYNIASCIKKSCEVYLIHHNAYLWSHMLHFFSIRIYPTCAHGAHKNGYSISLVTNSKMNIKYLLNRLYESLNGTENWTRTPKIYFGAWIRHFELHYKSIASMSNNNFLDLVQSKYQKVLKNHLRFF